MTPDPAIPVTPLEPGRYAVEVRQGGLGNAYQVAVPDGFLAGLGLLQVDPAEVIAESFRFLLEREPAGSILREFSLDQIAHYFPEYYDALRERIKR